MKTRDDDLGIFRVRPDDLTLARLIELADLCHTDPATLICAILHDVLEDDFLAHGGYEPLLAPGTTTLQ